MRGIGKNKVCNEEQQTATETELRNRATELVIENMNKNKEIERLKDELAETKKELEKTRRICRYQDSIIHVQKELGDKHIEISDTEADYLTRQQRIFENKVKHGFNTTNIYQEARYILEEVAELMRAIEKNDRENMIEELADVVIFAYGCAEVARLGDLDTKIFEKMQLNESRKYKQTPEGDFVKTN